MARIHGFRFARRIDAPVEVVWDLLADHAAYDEWTPVPLSRLEVTGTEQRNGVGAVRFLGVGPVGTREEVVAFTPNAHLAYGIVSGMPVRNHRADVRLRDDGGRTAMVYEGRFESTLPLAGPLLGLVMKGVIRTLIGALEKAALEKAALR